MSKRMYERGKPIKSMADFENSNTDFYIVRFGNREKTVHRSFLISWQYRVLSNFISRGLVFAAKKKVAENRGFA